MTLMVYKQILIGLIYLSSITKCQIPSIGGCRTIQTTLKLKIEQYLGTWYEVERYFTINELASRCIAATYERRADGKIWVNNVMTNQITNVQQNMSGTVELTGVGVGGEATYTIHYTTLLVNYNITMTVLGTDYNNYAVVWSCNGIGSVVHSESAWLMTRKRNPPAHVLKKAYRVLKQFGFSRSSFLKTDQNNCDAVPPVLFNRTIEIPRDPDEDEDEDED
ncbi:apolipoprotein D-like isoform X2 [Bradysia coprophila]|uniref:apolipoprotein D-like isoform X1 n=1 Tax=Bradysia coprophila TaxID=38358 RepID=UPI00187DC27D|nr:apolipoprotein D-like isoform X1 [Bradysia coprophila]XP_037038723.1 apolipoprotein D-like isoform X2 [Bradysia coprophila]